MPIPLIIHIEVFFVMLHGEWLDTLVLKAFSEQAYLSNLNVNTY